MSEQISEIQSDNREFYVNAIKTTCNKESLTQLSQLMQKYHQLSNNLLKQTNSSQQFKDAFVGKFIKLSCRNWPNSQYYTYAYIKNVYVSVNDYFSNIRLSLVCSAFDCSDSSDSINKIGNFNKNRYIDFNCSHFLDFRINQNYNERSDAFDLFTVEDNTEPEFNRTDNVLEFITEDEYKRVFMEYSEKLYNELLK